jgi:hypothetical protein
MDGYFAYLARSKRFPICGIFHELVNPEEKIRIQASHKTDILDPYNGIRDTNQNISLIVVTLIISFNPPVQMIK